MKLSKEELRLIINALENDKEGRRVGAIERLLSKVKSERESK